MRINVNLATRPFVELRPFFVRLRVIMALLAVVAIALGFLGHAMALHLLGAQAEMAQLHAVTVSAEREKNRNEARMMQPPNSEVLARAHFLNALFLRKSFSWTAVMMDLETVLPVGVQVTSIEPEATASGAVLIRLRVSGDRDRAVQLVRNLEGSRRFLNPRLTGETSQNKEGANSGQFNPNVPAGVEFDILAQYKPLPENESYHYERRVDEAIGAAVAATPRMPARTLPVARPVQRPVVVPPARPVIVPQARPVPPAYRQFQQGNGQGPRNGMSSSTYGQGRPFGRQGWPRHAPMGMQQGGQQ